jgi:hydrogenase maturation protein HypF
VPAAVIAAAFHLAVTELVVEVARSVRERTGLDAVALSGGVFLNALLTQLCSEGLLTAGFRVLRHRLVPPSDAGLALGQVMIAARLAASDRTDHRAAVETIGAAGECTGEQGRTSCA